MSIVQSNISELQFRVTPASCCVVVNWVVVYPGCWKTTPAGRQAGFGEWFEV